MLGYEAGSMNIQFLSIIVCDNTANRSSLPRIIGDGQDSCDNIVIPSIEIPSPKGPTVIDSILEDGD